MSKQNYPVYAGAIVQAPDGKILCQLRDNKPGIICPGKWSCSPGGMVEEGELPDAAILRELMEEFEIEVSKLTLLLVHTEHNIEYQGIYYGFTADLVTPVEEVKCNEGERAEFFLIKNAIELPQHPVSHIFLQHYFESETRNDANNNCCHSEP